jgi:hypothetical protein
LGAGGRAFKSPRPDQLKTNALFAMSGFRRTSAPVAICGVLWFLEALNSYKFDYRRSEDSKSPSQQRFALEFQAAKLGLAIFYTLMLFEAIMIVGIRL